MKRPQYIEPDLHITSAENPKIKLVKSLRDRRDRDTTGLFLIEGYRELSRAVSHNVQIETVLYSPSHFLGEHEETLLLSCRKAGARLLEIKDTLFEKLSYRDRPDGLIAVAYKMKFSIEDIIQRIRHKKNGQAPFCVIAEAIEKPGNLGTILRSSDAAGVDVVIVANGCTDIYNPNVVRASVGTLFTVPVIELSNEEALRVCQELKLSLIAASPEGQAIYTDVPMRGPIGIIVGTEQTGLTSFWKASSTHLAQIPMQGEADSLNVATATTLFLFEAVRQRYSQSK